MATQKKGLVFAPPENWEKLRNSPACVALVKDLAEDLARAAGGQDMGYQVTELVLEESRAAASVMATGRAHFHNQKHHALLRALSTIKRS